MIEISASRRPAIHSNRDGGDVKTTGAESDGEIRISISNTGPGIPDAEIDKHCVDAAIQPLV
jgi:signal transduction histidine kinase